MSRHRKKRLRTKQNLQASSWHLVSITQYLCVAFMMGDSILAWQKLEILPQNKCLELISSLPFNMVQIYVLRTSGLVQWVMMLQYHFNCKSTWGTSKWLMKSIQSIQTLTSQKLSVQGNTIPYHILNFTFVWAANACSASHNTALTDLFSPVWVFRESWDIAGKAMCSTSFLPRVNFFRQMSLSFQENLESNNKRRRK